MVVTSLVVATDDLVSDLLHDPRKKLEGRIELFQQGLWLELLREGRL